MDKLSPFSISEDDCFFFESDHLALRGNKDYCEVLKYLVIISAQREKLIKDYNKIIETRKNVLEDSENILKKIQNAEDIGIELPPRIDIPKIPVINFEKYSAKISEAELNSIYTDNSQIQFEDECKKEQDKDKQERNWSAEEQKKLEELLMKYPPEPIERRRFQKIAKELGNRSVTQVTSRIQKYFLKLYKAGLPIPGRIPKSFEKHKKSFLHKHQRHNHFLWKPTTFFPELNPPVIMNETDNVPGPSVNTKFSTGSSASGNYLIETNYHSNAEINHKTKAELQLQLLKKIREVKLREQESGRGFPHIGYKCDYCNTEPIIGTRWQCTVCPESIDFCTDCLISQIYTNNSHPLTHPMVICQDDEQHRMSRDASFSKNEHIKEDDSSDSFEFDYGDNTEKEDNEECLETDEESRSNFDGDNE